jgi:Zn-dependent protease
MGIYQVFISDPLTGVMLLLVYVVSLSLHEFGHAITAVWMGDDLPRHEGRVTLNPLKHLDPVGFILIIFAGFGWAKPVYTYPERYRQAFWGNLLVSSAGIIINLALAVLALLLLRLLGGDATAAPDWLLRGLTILASVNISLAVFNALPIPPLDGSHILATLVPGKLGEMLRANIANSWILLLIAVVVLREPLGQLISLVRDWLFALFLG